MRWVVDNDFIGGGVVMNAEGKDVGASTAAI
jgi:hypothetical protein